MSYENKGSMVSSVVVAQDGTGNYNCSGANDQVEILLAINYANTIGVNQVSIKAGTYDINGLTIATDVVLVGVEEGVVFSLPVQPSITVTAAVDYIVFERIEFLSVLDDSDIIRFNPVKGTFRYCKFDFQLDTGVDDCVIYYFNDVDASDIIFEQCELIGGKAGATGFGFFYTGENMGSMVIRNFRIINITCDTTAGAARLWTGDNTKVCDMLKAQEVIWEYLTGGGATDSAFIYGDFRCTAAIVDGFYFLDATLGAGHEMAPTGTFAKNLNLSNVICLVNVHGYSGLEIFNMSNVILIGDNTGGTHWDLQTTGEAEKYGNISNCYFYNASIGLNSRWKKVNVSNCMFRGARLWIGDEDVPNQSEAREIYVDNCQWQHHDSPYKYEPFFLQYSKHLYLEKLSVSNCHFKDTDYLFLPDGIPHDAEEDPLPTHIILENVTLTPRQDNNWPTIFDDFGRDDDSQIIWIFDSDIVTKDPPLGDWNPIRTNDRFDNVRWTNTVGSVVTYSEFGGKDTIANGAAAQVVAHNLVVSPDTWGYVQITGAENSVECTSLTVHTVGAANFTCQFLPEVGGPNVTADRDFYWYAHIKP